MLFCHKIHYILMINALLSQKFVVEIYALFPPIFLGWQIDPANFFAFWMYACYTAALSARSSPAAVQSPPTALLAWPAPPRQEQDWTRDKSLWAELHHIQWHGTYKTIFRSQFSSSFMVITTLLSLSIWWLRWQRSWSWSWSWSWGWFWSQLREEWRFPSHRWQVS